MNFRAQASLLPSALASILVLSACGDDDSAAHPSTGLAGIWLEQLVDGEERLVTREIVFNHGTGGTVTSIERNELSGLQTCSEIPFSIRTEDSLLLGSVLYEKEIFGEALELRSESATRSFVRQPQSLLGPCLSSSAAPMLDLDLSPSGPLSLTSLGSAIIFTERSPKFVDVESGQDELDNNLTGTWQVVSANGIPFDDTASLTYSMEESSSEALSVFVRHSSGAKTCSTHSLHNLGGNVIALGEDLYLSLRFEDDLTLFQDGFVLGLEKLDPSDAPAPCRTLNVVAIGRFVRGSDGSVSSVNEAMLPAPALTPKIAEELGNHLHRTHPAHSVLGEVRGHAFRNLLVALSDDKALVADNTSPIGAIARVNLRTETVITFTDGHDGKHQLSIQSMSLWKENLVALAFDSNDGDRALLLTFDPETLALVDRIEVLSGEHMEAIFVHQQELFARTEHAIHRIDASGFAEETLMLPKLVRERSESTIQAKGTFESFIHVDGILYAVGPSSEANTALLYQVTLD